jgi:hypothetical protein
MEILERFGIHPVRVWLILIDSKPKVLALIEYNFWAAESRPCGRSVIYKSDVVDLQLPL